MKEQLKDYLEINSLGIEILSESGKTVHFEFWNDKKESKKFRSLLNKLELSYKEDKDEDGGSKIDMFDLDKKQVKQLLGS